MRPDADTYYSEPRGMLTLWAGLLLGPIAWLAHQASSYLLVYWSCGTGHRFAFHIVSVLMLAAAGAGAWLALGAWRGTGKGWADDGGGRSDRGRFMAVAGMMASGLFALAIVAQWIPTFLVDPCVR
ncbi:MAG: hypothetical protein KIT09_10480 [Bryobacteraceae bacterium]|nr:hypothetical protein [Bryobacteraceae bacterium]